MLTTRPPPLVLQHDNTLPNPGRFVAPKRAARAPPDVPRQPSQLVEFWNKLYKANWRNVVIAVAGINALRFCINATNSFQDIRDDKLNHVPRLAHISCAICGIYLLTTAIQIFGVISALSERLSLIRIYTHLSFLSALLIAVAGFIGGVTYFVLSDDLVRECVSLAVMGSVQTRPLFRGKDWKYRNPTAKVAQDHCFAAWSRASVTQVLSVFLFSIIPAALFFLLAFMYYRQVTDPEHPATLCPRDNNGSNPTSGRDGDSDERRGRNKKIPAIHLNGSPLPQGEDRTGTRRSKSLLKGKKRATLIELNSTTSSTSPYMISPGPPSYAASVGCSYGYGDSYQPTVNESTSFNRGGTGRSD